MVPRNNNTAKYQIPEPLLEDIVEGKCLPFIGAGFSLNARASDGFTMPDWDGLTAILAKRAGVENDGNGPDIASVYRNKFGRVQLIEAVRRALNTDHVEPGEAHKAFATLFFDTVYSTNFDLLIEDAYSQFGRPFRSLVGEHQMPFHGGPKITSIVKMHGDLNHEEHIVITREDYECYLEKYAVIATHLSAMLITKTALYIGYSLSDPDFKNIREVIKSRLGEFERMSYIIQFDKPEQYIEERLKENLYVISITPEPGITRDNALAGFFSLIRQRVDAIRGTEFWNRSPGSLEEEVTYDRLEEVLVSEDGPALLTGLSNICFVSLPKEPAFEPVYERLVHPVVEKFGLMVMTTDRMYTRGLITEASRVAIKQAKLFIGDISYRNPNILFEIETAVRMGKPTVLLANNIEDLPTGKENLRFIVYDAEYPEKAKTDLEFTIRHVLGEDILAEAKRLHEDGAYRAAVALLGVLLESAFQQLILQNRAISRKRLKGRKLGLRQLLNLISEAEIIKSKDKSALAKVIDVRNKAVHTLDEPSADVSLSVIKTVELFIKKYLGSAFQDK